MKLHLKKIGQKATDLVAQWVGSWKFVNTFILILVCWTLFNKYDPSPYMLLNTYLGWFTALTTPILLMASNRQEEISTARSSKDLKTDMDTNKKINELSDKIDTILKRLS